MQPTEVSQSCPFPHLEPARPVRLDDGLRVYSLRSLAWAFCLKQTGKNVVGVPSTCCKYQGPFQDVFGPVQASPFLDDSEDPLVNERWLFDVP